MFLAFLDWAVPVAAGLLIGILFATRKNVDTSQIIVLDIEEFRHNMRKGQLIDIRSNEAYAKSHISGAKNFPKKSVFGELSKLRADMAIFIVAESDKGLANSVARKLYKKGFKPIYILQKGLSSWNYPLKEE
ncbi:MAG: rhodanese-like domain-containing protein [Candidatus Izemoplasmatales bacterium]